MTTCITNRCSRGHAPCPTPGVCNGGTSTPAPTWPAVPNRDETSAHTDDQTHTVDEAAIWILGAACLFGLVALIAGTAGYLSLHP